MCNLKGLISVFTCSVNGGVCVPSVVTEAIVQSEFNYCTFLLDIEKSQNPLMVPGQDVTSDFITAVTNMTLYPMSALRSQKVPRDSGPVEV